MNKMNSFLKSEVLTIILAGVSMFVVVMTLIMFQIRKSDRAVVDGETKCYKQLTLIVQGSSGTMVDWIGKTVLAEQSSIRGPNYCRALELVSEAGMREGTNDKTIDKKGDNSHDDK